MISIIILIILAIGFYLGYRRGFLLQGVRFIGYLITFFLANRYYDSLSRFVEMVIPFPAIQPNSTWALYSEQMSFLLDDAFYRVITFALIGLIGWLVTNFLSILFQPLMYYEMMHYVDAISGGLLNLGITYGIIFLVLFILSLLPIEFIQQQFVNNPLAYWIVSQSPFLSDFASNMWLGINPF